MMKKGTYIASTQTSGSVMFRVNSEAYTIRKGQDKAIEISDERTKVSYPESYMTFSLKTGVSKTPEEEVETKPEVEVETKQEELAAQVESESEQEELATQVESESVPKEEVKKEIKAKPINRKKAVTIETKEK